MLRFRSYNVSCPACQHQIEILPPQSIVAENRGLAHKCPGCRKWLATYVRRTGSTREPEIRVIEGSTGPDESYFLRGRMVG